MTAAGRASPAAPAERDRPAGSDFGGPYPWTSDDVVRLLGAWALALVVVAASWFATSEESAWNDAQVLWVNVGAAGVMVAALAGAMWVLRGRRAVGRKRLLLLGDPPAAAEAATTALPVHGGAREVDGVARPLAGGMLSGKGMTRFHREGCPMIAGKQVRRRPRSAYEAGGRTPCPICLGDD